MKIVEALPLLKIHGRHIVDEKEGALYVNWTCSGFTVGVKGTFIRVHLKALYDQVPDFFFKGEPPKDWPCVAFSVDGSEELIGRQKIDIEDKWIEVKFAESEESHEIRLIKLSENARGKLAVSEIETDGEFYEANKSPKKKIEIIGDSITCAFGNETDGKEFKPFDSADENGWKSYAAIAARKMDYDFSMVCESGICAIHPEHPQFEMHAMEDIYAYEDCLLNDKRKEERKLHEFDNDIVVVSLGTNDSNPIRFAGDFDKIEPMENWFENHYIEFLKQIRKLNGKDTEIISCLGSMDYYLYYRIYNAVKRYQEETGDSRIHCFEFLPLNAMFEGIGGAGHPSQKTHDRMADELIKYIRKFIGA